MEYDALSRRTFAVDANSQTTQWVYDGVSRVVQSMDAVGNYRQTAYDNNSNPTCVTSTEISPEGLVPSEVFTTLYVWDALDRLARVTDNVGQTATLTYDSRNQLTDTSDAVGPLVNDPLEPLHEGADQLGRATRATCSTTGSGASRARSWISGSEVRAATRSTSAIPPARTERSRPRIRGTRIRACKACSTTRATRRSMSSTSWTARSRRSRRTRRSRRRPTISTATRSPRRTRTGPLSRGHSIT